MCSTTAAIVVEIGIELWPSAMTDFVGRTLRATKLGTQRPDTASTCALSLLLFPWSANLAFGGQCLISSLWDPCLRQSLHTAHTRNTNHAIWLLFLAPKHTKHTTYEKKVFSLALWLTRAEVQ